MWNTIWSFILSIFAHSSTTNPPVVNPPAPTPAPVTPPSPPPAPVVPAPAVTVTRPADLPASNHYASMSLGVLEPEYRYLFSQATVQPTFQAQATHDAQKAVAQKAMYGGTIVPWYIIAAIHNLEASLDPSCQILNGEHWNKVTKLVPAGKGPFSSFADSLTFAIADYQKPENWGVNLSHKNWNDWGWCFWFMESWNGFGSRRLTNPNTTPLNASAYIYSAAMFEGNPLFLKGKDTSDNNFDPNAPSEEVGAMAFLKTLQQIGAI